ncbi:MAG TPA: aminoglycoside phosphotransferase, partial [Gammaproteobacteria bacterium]|nr:aminoglycoside phosphotransferase [Gammaproteobacteria bacterium]
MQNKIREITLNQWLETVLADKSLDVTPASEDASFRRYFRVQRGGETWIAMDAPPDKEDCRPFVKIAAAFRFMGMNVPEVYAQDLDNGFLLLTDFGSICYLDRLNQRNADDLYADAMHALLDLQSHEKPRNVDLPAYDEVLLRQEMGLFNDWFLDRHVQIRLDESEASDLQVV